MQDKISDGYMDHRHKGDEKMHAADDAHINATIPWWAGWGGGGYHRCGTGVGVTGMILGIIALVIILFFFFGWAGFGHDRYDRGYDHRGGYENGYHEGGYGYGGGLRGAYYQDQTYKLGDELAQVKAERYADVVGWKVYDKAVDTSRYDLNQYAMCQRELNQKDQLIAKLYTDSRFDKAECGISHCIKELPGMVDSKQLVAPIGPVVKRQEYEMVCNERRDFDRFDGRGYAGYDARGVPYPPQGLQYPGFPFTNPVVSTPATLPVTVYPQPLVTTTTTTP